MYVLGGWVPCSDVNAGVCDADGVLLFCCCAPAINSFFNCVIKSCSELLKFFSFIINISLIYQYKKYK